MWRGTRSVRLRSSPAELPSLHACVLTDVVMVSCTHCGAPPTGPCSEAPHTQDSARNLPHLIRRFPAQAAGAEAALSQAQAALLTAERQLADAQRQLGELQAELLKAERRLCDTQLRAEQLQGRVQVGGAARSTGMLFWMCEGVGVGGREG